MRGFAVIAVYRRTTGISTSWGLRAVHRRCWPVGPVRSAGHRWMGAEQIRGTVRPAVGIVPDANDERGCRVGERSPVALRGVRAVCSRCQALTDAQVQAFTAGTIAVGPIGYTAQGKLVPVELAARLSARERELLVALLLAQPGVASYQDLADPRWAAKGEEEARAEVRAQMGRLNDQIIPYDVRAVNRTRQGYYLVKLEG